MITGYLHDIIIILAFAIIIVAIGKKFRIPGIVGFLLTGILIGPYGLGFIRDTEIIDVLAEIGIIFLLFTIGMQFSFRTLYEMRKIVLIGGTLQVVLNRRHHGDLGTCWGDDRPGALLRPVCHKYRDHLALPGQG